MENGDNASSPRDVERSQLENILLTSMPPGSPSLLSCRQVQCEVPCQVWRSAGPPQDGCGAPRLRARKGLRFWGPSIFGHCPCISPSVPPHDNPGKHLSLLCSPSWRWEQTEFFLQCRWGGQEKQFLMAWSTFRFS